MQRTSTLTVAFGIVICAVALWAQGPTAPWRGVSAIPCVWADGGIHQCPPAPRTIVVRAGRLFDSKTGQMRTKQVVVLQGERITAVGPDARVKIPAGAHVIDLGQAAV